MRRRSGFAMRTVVPRPASVSISNASINRRAPRMPSPRPVDERKTPASTASISGMPLPRSRTTISSCCASSPASQYSTRPPLAYSQAFLAISETAVVMRVWSCLSKPKRLAICRVLWRTWTMSVSRSRPTISSRVFTASPASRSRQHRPCPGDGRERECRRSGSDGWSKGRDSRRGSIGRRRHPNEGSRWRRPPRGR